MKAKSNTDRVKAYRENQKKLGRKERQTYLTADEYLKVKEFIKELRAN